DDDDPAASLLEHSRHRLAAAQEDSAHVDLEDAPPRHGSSSRNDAVGPATPALLTRRSTPPSSANHRSTSSSRETSPTSARPPISRATDSTCSLVRAVTATSIRSEEHTSELQSLRHLVCRLLLE